MPRSLMLLDFVCSLSTAGTEGIVETLRVDKNSSVLDHLSVLSLPSRFRRAIVGLEMPWCNLRMNAARM
jgi:hypothetical protein